jgi:protein-disulfide isomerase
MTHRSTLRARLAPVALAGALALLSSVTACGAQQPSGGGERQAQGEPRVAGAAVSNDSLLKIADRGRMKGAETAPVTILEVSDFQCPYCRQWAEQTYAKLDSAYIKTGKVKLVFIHYPLPNHAEAYPASKAALCAGVQGQFWPMHDRIFATQREWGGSTDAAQRFARFATELKLDAAQYRDCYDNDRVAAVVMNDVSGVAGAGIRGTPTFILNGQQALNGAVSFEEMSQAIDALLAGGGAAAPAPAPGQAPPPPPPAP